MRSVLGMRVPAEWEAAHYPLPVEDDCDIPVVSLKRCEFDKSRKVLKLASEYFGMPREFFVESHHTGRVVRFVAVGPEDKLFDQDQWDGEQQIYRPVGGEFYTNVDHMVIYHAW